MTTTTNTKHRIHNPPQPGTTPWRKTISASKVPSLILNADGTTYAGFGYDSAWEIYLAMTTDYQKTYSDDTLKMFQDGHDAEHSAIVRGVRHLAEKTETQFEEWDIEPQVTYTDDALPFPNLATLDALVTHKGLGLRINIESKRPRYNRTQPGWIIQTIFQQNLANTNYSLLVTDPIYGEPEFITIDPNPEQYKQIIQDVNQFYIDHVVLNQPPHPGASESFADWHSTHNPNPRDDENLTLTDDEIADYINLVRQLKELQTEVETRKNDFIQRLGAGRKVFYDSTTVLARKSGTFGVSKIPAKHRHVLDDPDLYESKFSGNKLKAKYPNIYQEAQGQDTYSLEQKAWSN